jgi:putative membrane-bound dehydrogenase-like protein
MRANTIRPLIVRWKSLLNDGIARRRQALRPADGVWKLRSSLRQSEFGATLRVFCLAIVATVAPLGRAQDPPFREILSKLKPKSPLEAMDCFQVRDGFRVELVCAEPLVHDPIAIDWGADGRLWVVEMGDYPQGGDGSETSRGRVKYLEDQDGDGRYDRSQVFVDNLNLPLGVMPWGKGVLITCAPDILYAEDTDGDGTADRREVMYQGFVEGNPQHRVNGLRWGLDNWIYGANGDSGGTITSLKTGEQVDIHARDFRIRPDTGAIETQTGMTQYGRCRDDWGNWFGGRNLQPSWHCALEDHYLRRNPFLTPTDPCVDLMDPPTCARVYPISAPLPRFNELWTFNRFTASCGLEVYRDDLFGPEFANSYFVCEPAYNLVHHSVLHRKGTTFFSRRAPQESSSEFLASSDHWFRPVQVRTGPDGALWVVDMYRLVIEHPDYIPARWHDQLDFTAGRGLGRIYRVLPANARPRAFRSLGGLSTEELVQALDDPNGPKRDLIQQRLIERGDLQAIPPLRRLVTDNANPKTRLSALCTLDGLHAADVGLLVQALSDRHEGVRRHAVRISEPLLNDQPAIQEVLVKMVTDPDPQVRMQLAYSLGEWRDPRAGQTLAALAVHDADDSLMIAAVMSSATSYPGEMLEKILDSGTPRGSQVVLLENLLRLVLESQQVDSLAGGLRRIATPVDGRFETWQYQVMAGLVDAIQYSGDSLRDLHERSVPEMGAALEATAGLFAAARVDAVDATLDPERRLQAVRLVGRGLERHEDDVQRLADQLVASTPVKTQQTIVNVLGILQPDNLPDVLLDQWVQHGPDIRPQILETLLRKQTWTIALLNRIAAGTVAANEIGAVNRNKLILHTSAEIRSRASALLSSTSPAERLAAIERYRTKLTWPADAARGREIFRKQCAPCHRLENEGTMVGPDLLALTDRSSEALMVSILDPNRAVEPRFVEYSAVTKSGQVFAGIIAAETGNGVTLIDAQAANHALLRSDLDELVSTGRSLMPTGAEELLNEPQDLLDLIAYLRSVEADPYGSEAEVRGQR